jgi:Fungal chitosanase of glycosyl hydrolase group 75/Fibronectin type III domain
MSDTNIAPTGTGYTWSKDIGATSNNNRVAAPGINDNNLTHDVDVQPDGDNVDAWEAAGVVFSRPQTISSVGFINGTVTSEGDGFLEANISLQVSTDGTTWTESGWSISPAYPYSSSASGSNYTFTGAALSGVVGVRVSGQVRTRDESYHWIVKEVQIFSSGSGTGSPNVPTGLASPGQSSTSVNLSWNAVTAPPGCSVSYNVCKDGAPVQTVSTTTATISGLAADTTYSFTVASLVTSAQSGAISVKTSSSSDYTPDQVLAGVKANMTSSIQVNSQPHLNSQTQEPNINVYQVVEGYFAFTSGMAIDTDGSDPDPDPDHQDQTAWQDVNGAQLGAHHVPYYVLGDVCPDGQSPCKWFYYTEHNITGLQFGLIFYNGQCIGAVFGDTVGSPDDPRKLGEASVKSAQMFGIPSSGTTGGADDGVTYVVFSGSEWVVAGTNETLKDNAQALVQKALNTLGSELGL